MEERSISVILRIMVIDLLVERRKEKNMRKAIVVLTVLIILASMTLVAIPSVKAGAVLEVGPGKAYAHPQDAVNAASPGDTILVYPGTYDSRQYTTKPPHYSANDQWAPALIVYKNDLTIEAADPDPSLTIIQSTHNYWSNPVAIQASTGGTWNGARTLMQEYIPLMAQLQAR